jgi:HTH-type transcriptional regulator/antitoxin HigA
MVAEPAARGDERLGVPVPWVGGYGWEHFPLDLPNRFEANKFVMEQRGLTIKDSEPMVGWPNRFYAVLNHKRSLTFKMT